LATLADVLRQCGAAYLATHVLSTAQAKAWRGIVACRTPALGGQQLACDSCGHRHWQYHSCRNRHCPQCGARAKDAWLQGRLAQVLPVPYAHLVFTLPHSLNALYGYHPRWVIDTLFACTAQTLSQFAANPRWMGGMGSVGGNAGSYAGSSAGHPMPAFSLVLHTWTQDLQLHIHVHAVMACGALDAQGHWLAPVRTPDFLFPVHALSQVFRGKFMAALQEAHQTGQIPRDPHGDSSAWRKRHAALYRHSWVVYAKSPMGGPAQVLEYLSRYTHRTAISNERIQSVGAQQVVFKVRGDDQDGKRLVRLDGTEFVRRFMLHILPKGVKRIRHYGVLASACKASRLAQARAALLMPALNPQARESAAQFMCRVRALEIMRCPCCALDQLRLVQTVPAPDRLPAPGATVQAGGCRGPPCMT
jgi:Putative transposase/Transposase zinc-binding domain